ncbi:MAG: aldehyde dehydrogenase family protein, partial [Butyrivibrio sp.]|nr:aldehyde dehydrogenase family protein [Butyrivibrio sp.]
MELIEICKKAKKVKYEIQCLTTKEKNDALLAVADKLVAEADSIIAANAKDYERGVSNGMHKGLLDRLLLDKKRIEAMAEGLKQVAALPDPIGEVIDSFVRPNGLKIKKVRVPMGVIGIIYEARPNVTADAFALTFKAGNAVVLKGGSDAIDSNIQIANVMRAALGECGINPDAIQLIEDTDRAVTTKFMQMNEYIDVLIPRGSARLINAVVENSTIPVI